MEEIVPSGSIKTESWVYYIHVLEEDCIGDQIAAAGNQAEVEASLESSGANIVVGTDGSLRENITASGGAITITFITITLLYFLQDISNKKQISKNYLHSIIYIKKRIQ